MYDDDIFNKFLQGYLPHTYFYRKSIMYRKVVIYIQVFKDEYAGKLTGTWDLSPGRSGGAIQSLRFKALSATTTVKDTQINLFIPTHNTMKKMLIMPRMVHTEFIVP